MPRKLGGAYFARLALDYFDHPKIASLSAEAIVAHLEMIVYSRRYLTDGRVPQRVVQRFDERVVDELCTNDPTSPSLVLNDDGSGQLHDYDDAQETRADVEAKRLAGKTAGKASAEKRKQPSNGSSNKSFNGSSTKRSTEEEEEEENSSEVAEATPREDVNSLCNRLADRIEANGSKRPTITKSWRDAARLMLDRDGRDQSEAERLIDWCQNDDFWRGNVMSMPKFRSQFDQLRLKAKTAPTARPLGSNDDARQFLSMNPHLLNG
ncbi:hypothetical protein [Brachybacterium subflavum]|uniref:hypothetical protein n=1 Tax=Brachybacterium subflavum TaxID=2585206 RepID=UPI0012661155|nr:hypothetical protein [Brachybacterium subflavum]